MSNKNVNIKSGESPVILGTSTLNEWRYYGLIPSNSLELTITDTTWTDLFVKVYVRSSYAYSEIATDIATFYFNRKEMEKMHEHINPKYGYTYGDMDIVRRSRLFYGSNNIPTGKTYTIVVYVYDGPRYTVRLQSAEIYDPTASQSWGTDRYEDIRTISPAYVYIR